MKKIKSGDGGLVSVIIPAYNGERFIYRTIKSVLKQTYQNFEIIVIDDHSADKTRMVVKKIANKKIRYFYLKKNSGTVYARNIGIKKAKGEFIAFLDHDDEWLPEKLFEQVSLLENDENQKIGIVGCDYYFITSQKTKIIKTRKTNFKNLLKNNFIATSTILVRKALFNQIGYFDARLKFTEDWDIWIRIMRDYQYANINKPLARYYFYQENTTNTLPNLTKISSYFYIIKKHYKLFNRLPRALSFNYKQIATLFVLDQNRKQGIKYLQKAIKTSPFILRNYINLLVLLAGEKFYIEILNLKKKILESDWKIFLLKFIKIIILRSAKNFTLARWKLIGLFKNEKEIQINGLYFSLPLKDKGIAMDLLLNDGVREPLFKNQIKKEVKSGDIAVSIGANLGFYALEIAKSVGPKGRVLAIEPVKSNFNFLRKNIERNNFLNIFTHQIAIGEKNRASQINISSHSNWAALDSTLAKELKFIGRQKVKILTLDEFLKNKPMPNFIHMDVEGYETKIIEGMKKTLKKAKRLKIAIELHPHLISRTDFQKMINALCQNNFKIRWAAAELSPEQIFVENKPWLKKIISALPYWQEDIKKTGVRKIDYADLLNLRLMNNSPISHIIFSKK